MVMDFHPWREGLYGFFGSIYKKVMKLFIHPHEGYGVTFKPSNRRLCLVSSSRTLVTKTKKVMKLFIHPHEGYGVTFKPSNRRLCLVSSSRTLVTKTKFPSPQLFPITSILSGWLP